MQTAVCTERTDVLVLEMKHYERLFVRRHPRTIDSMRQILKVKLETRSNLLKSKEDVPFLGLLQNRIDSYSNPKPSVEKKTKDLMSSSVAEKEFLNHKGPLIDMYGPGSVFYMIRVREKQKQKSLKSMVKKQDNNGHMHSARIPQTLVLAAQMAGALKDFDAISEKSEPLPSRIVSHRIASARSLPSRVPRSFRKIQSATNPNPETDEDENEKGENLERHENGLERSADFEEPETYVAKSLPEPRNTFVTFPDTKEDMALRSLEDRVREWLDKNNTSRKAMQVASLRRLPMQVTITGACGQVRVV